MTEIAGAADLLYNALTSMVETHRTGGDLIVSDRLQALELARRALKAARRALKAARRALKAADVLRGGAETRAPRDFVLAELRKAPAHLLLEAAEPGRDGPARPVELDGCVAYLSDAAAADLFPRLGLRSIPPRVLLIVSGGHESYAQPTSVTAPILDLDEALEPKPTRWACGFCGLDLGLWRKGDAKEVTAMAEHIDACDKHPMRKAVNEVAGLRSLLELAEERDLVKILTRQFAWSLLTYGEGCMTEAILKHIGKEVAEVRKDPHDPVEWIDIALLALDGAWRCRKGGRFSGGTIASLVTAKMAENRGRTWAQGADGVFEHVRDGATS